MSNLQLSIIGGLALWVLFVMLVLLLLGINRSQQDQDDNSVTRCVHESRPMPLDSAYVRGVQAATRHVRAGSIE